MTARDRGGARPFTGLLAKFPNTFVMTRCLAGVSMPTDTPSLPQEYVEMATPVDPSAPDTHANVMEDQPAVVINVEPPQPQPQPQQVPTPTVNLFELLIAIVVTTLIFR